MKSGNHFFKTFYITLVFILTLPLALSAQKFGEWEYEHPDYPPNNLTSVSFADQDDVWAVGDNGLLIYSPDGGFSWSFQDLGLRTDFSAIQFIDDQNGWIVGDDGLILHTSNGGNQWSFQNSGTSRKLFNIYFLDKNIGWAVGRSSTILKTTNGGMNWEEADHSYSDGTLYSIQFLNEDFGMAVGTKSTSQQVYMKTEDGGETWDETSIGSPDWFYDLHIFNEDNIIISTRNGRIRTTSDGGDTWDLTSVTSNSSSLETIHFIDENKGWIGGTVDEDGNTPVQYTEDGGENWTEINSEFSGNIKSIDVLQDGYFVAVGFRGNVSTTTDNGNTVHKLPDDPNYALLSMEFIDSENGWIAGNTGLLLNTTDGGENWNIVKKTNQDRFSDIFFADDMNGWIAGSNGQLRKTTDSGLNWETIETVTDNNLLSITFTDPSTGWAVGSSGTVIRTDTGGDTWVEIDVDASYPLYSVAFVNDTTGFIGGGSFSDGGYILQTLDAGETWEVSQSLSERITDINFINDSIGWAVGGSGTILKTENAGTSWITQSSNSSATLNSVSFSDPQNGWAVGFGGETLYTTDGGSTWREFDSVNGLTLEAVYIDNANRTWAVGDNGLILKFNQSDSPKVVNLFYPDNQSTDVSVNAELLWGMSYSASSYELQIATDQSFNSLIVDESEIPSNLFILETELGSDEIYYWRVRTDHFGVKSEWSEVYSFTTELATSINGNSDLPREFTLKQNYPNPFNPSTVIEFALPQTSNVRLEVFNIVGQRVATLANETRQAGVHQVDFDASHFASGIYFYRLETGRNVMTRSMMLIK